MTKPKKFPWLILVCPYCDLVAVLDTPDGDPPETCPKCLGLVHGGHMTVDAVDMRDRSQP